MGITKTEFGKTKEGKTAYLYTLNNSKGMKAAVSDFGAVLQALWVPFPDGSTKDVVLGFDELKGYFENDPGFGAVIGRHANRIGNAEFTLNGKEYHLAKNDGENNLHSNPHGYHRRLWEAEVCESELGEAVAFHLFSPDGDQGFPGNLDVTVTYTLTEENSLMIHYYASGDQDTVVNMTNHSYFNLSGHDAGHAVDQKVQIFADAYTRADAASIPTGEILSVEGTPMDFRVMKRISDEIDSDYEATRLGNGYDHNWILNGGRNEFRKVAVLSDERSGMDMEVHTDLPGIQFYTGNFLDGTLKGKGGCIYEKRAGVCFETQYYPDSVHHANFPSPVLKAGEEYDTTTVFRFIPTKDR
ncbi:MAG: aldose epimerase family protein [Lachnospiraceae bacterium]